MEPSGRGDQDQVGRLGFKSISWGTLNNVRGVWADLIVKPKVELNEMNEGLPMSLYKEINKN